MKTPTREILERRPVTGFKGGSTHIEVKVTYSKGGTNFLTYQQLKRGYYLHVKPIKLERSMVSFVLFSGESLFLQEVSRNTAKQFALAVDTVSQ